MRKAWGDTKCLNIITFHTETSKAAIQTACRGLNIDVDTARSISALVPVERGKAWSIHDCLFGNPEKDRKPVKEMARLIRQYDGLEETINEIEGLVSGRGCHASGFYLFNDEFVEQNSMMIAANGLTTTCWDQGDSDYCGALKVDFLTIKALDIIRGCMTTLLRDGRIQWQGSLKSTFFKYFSVANLDFDSPKMWKMANDGKICNLFQLETRVGSQAVRQVQPTTLKQLALTNSVMRLMGDGEINPIDRYTAFKNNIQLWYDEMNKAGLTQDEIHTLEKYLLANSGNSIEQEDIMLLSMDEHIAGFDIVLANKLRKGVA